MIRHDQGLSMHEELDNQIQIVNCVMSEWVHTAASSIYRQQSLGRDVFCISQTNVEICMALLQNSPKNWIQANISQS